MIARFLFLTGAPLAVLFLPAASAQQKPQATLDASVQQQLLEDVRILSADDMVGRLAGSEGGARARAYLTRRLKAIGVEPVYPTFEQAFEAKSRQGEPYNGVNLVGRIRGAGKGDRVLVIGAHYDHLGTHEGQIFNGADDNASGVAALLAIAQTFMRDNPQHDVIFGFWDAEERGMRGVSAFLDAPPVPLSRMVMNLNLDMLGRGDKGELWVAGTSHYPFLRARLEGLAATAPVTLKLGHDALPWKGTDDWTDGSDHREFHRRKIPFAYFGVEDHPDYHKPTDDFAKIPQDFYKGAAATVIDAARLFDRDLDAIAEAAGRSR
ncbi:M20/M25/M40 family metallo-hydrolase [Sphingomonas turrisvirgatae]|uniref:Peptidase M28 domain-containing protein n=1 Tax=Sphingomonas turrisvirgatae TaxID=1888892 RepID=A0A1E3M0Q4_9SPHN|nr:M20/M25/M40 family metallo-hydrolase [Sphingomonas turrisvirgatae]ODP39616.1 hypothetical protein BFL28_09770 [Sphingomonas turrisvirgatae]